MEATFSDERLLEMLSKMAPHQQLAFGAVRCERMLPSYQTFMREVGWRDVAPLREALDAVWVACESERITDAQLGELLSKCEECAPSSENFTSLYTSSAQDAVFAICSLLDFLLDGDVARVVSAARFSIDSVDLIVQEREAMDPRDPLREHKILAHPLMQQELLRQQRDLEEASQIAPGDRTALLAFRTRAQRESNLIVSS
ncbi:DUF416 family protein [Sorangium sp. So ce1335]|uniref:DUF416 family protein n=1 Tax=Sorangium sp. So ce1335 TaxID=3133335 RepID=UPI003F62EFF3